MASSFGITRRALVAKGEGLRAWAASARMLSRMKASFRPRPHSPDTGLLRWVANDRAVVALREAEANQRDLVSVVNRWVVT